MKDISAVKALVVDHGLGLAVAHKLAEKCDKVWYHSPYEEGFSTLNRGIIGDGFEDIERCNDPWGIKNDVDLWVFPDIEHAGWQKELEAQGKAVWGAKDGDTLELLREQFHEILGQVGLDVPKYRTIEGITSLRLFLMENEGPFYIKISRFRGSFETCKFRSWDLDSGLIDLWSVKLGPPGELVPFMVFDPIETDLEIGGDTYCIDGQWPDTMLRADEYKDKALIAAVTERHKMPQQILDVLEAFGPILAEYRYRQFWSMEIRVKDDKAYFGDATCRCPFPATGSQLEAYDNIPELIWAGANGELIQPEPVTKFSGELILCLSGDKKVWGTIQVPDKLQRWMKLQDCFQIGDLTCFPVNDDGDRAENIGWLVAQGDTLDEMVDTMQKQVQDLPDGVSADLEPMAHLLHEIQEAKEKGIAFDAKVIPEPSTVLDHA